MIKQTIIVFLHFLLVYQAYTQHTDSINTRQYIIGLRSHQGFIFRHSDELKNTTVQTYPWGIEADFSLLLTDKKSWSYCSCYPRTGFSFGYINFNSDLLGYALPLIGYIEPFISNGNTLSISIRFGIGLAYLNNPYDSIDNPDNLFYSTHISFPVVLNAGLNYRLNNHWNLRLSGSFNHISNGGIKKPNKGINYPTIKLGTDYTFNPYSLPEWEQSGHDLSKNRWRFMVASGGSAKPTHKGKKKRYPVYTINSCASRRLSRLSGISIGLEFINDLSLKQLLYDKGINKDHKRGAVLVGHEMLIGRFNFSQRVGLYLYSPYKAMDPVYQRYGLAFNLSELLYTGVSIKAHRHVADFLDFRIGCSF